MSRNMIKPISLLIICFLSFSMVNAEKFILVSKEVKVSIVYDSGGPALDSIAAYLLAADIHRVTGYLPNVFTDIGKAKGHVIILGSAASAIIKFTFAKRSDYLAKVQGKWECFALKVIKNLSPAIKQALVITGSDKRGTAYGV